MTTPSNWLDRYRAGQRDQVWHELRQLGDRVREPGLAEPAQLVCDEMARRARHNVDLIVSRLQARGYRTHTNDDQQDPMAAHVPPTATAPDLAAWLVERFGPVPMTVLSWLRLVGDVWLVGTHPEWEDAPSADPLVLQLEGSHHPHASVRDHYSDDHDGWDARRADDPGIAPFVLPVSPDWLHKANISGGGPYGFILPDGCVDGLFVADTTMPFVAYLNVVFRNGGFPRSTGGGRAQYRARRELSQDLLPL